MAVAEALAGSRMIRVGVGLWPLALIVAFPCVYLGVHWPTDILVGAALMASIAWFVLGGPANSRLKIDISSHKTSM